MSRRSVHLILKADDGPLPLAPDTLSQVNTGALVPPVGKRSHEHPQKNAMQSVASASGLQVAGNLPSGIPPTIPQAHPSETTSVTLTANIPTTGEARLTTVTAAATQAPPFGESW